MSVTANRKAILYNFMQKQNGGHISGSDAKGHFNRILKDEW